MSGTGSQNRVNNANQQRNGSQQPQQSRSKVSVTPQSRRSQDQASQTVGTPQPPPSQNVPATNNDQPQDASSLRVNGSQERVSPNSNQQRSVKNGAAADATVPNYTRDIDGKDFHANFGEDLSVFKEYLQQTSVEDVFQEQCHILLTRDTLPYNPYPGFVRRIRQKAEQFHTDDKSVEEIFKLFAQKYAALVEDLTPRQSTLQDVPRYSNQVTTALVGQAVFDGTFYDEPSMIAVRTEYLINGDNATVAVELFINSVIADLNFMEQQTDHVLLGVSLPVFRKKDDEVFTYDFWTMDMVHTNQNSFWQFLSDTVTSNKHFSAELILKVDPSVEKYSRLQKQYTFNFVQTSTLEQKREILTTFAELPMSTLFDGYFMKKPFAQAYVGTFLPRQQLAEGVGDIDEPSQSFHVATHPNFQVKRGPNIGAKIREKFGFAKFNREKVDIDGFRYRDTDGRYGPYAWQITAPIKSHWQKKIALNHEFAEIFDSAYGILLMVLLDRDKFDPQILVHLYRLFHSTAAKLMRCMEQNKIIREMILNFQGEEENYLVYQVFMDYKLSLYEMTHTDHHERSSDLKIIGKILDERLQRIITNEKGIQGSVPLEPDTVLELRFINLYCSAVFMQLIEDVVPEIPAVMDYIQLMKKTFPEYVQRPRTAVKGVSSSKDVVLPVRDRAKIKFKHGIEHDPLILQDRYVIDVDDCMERDMAPKSVLHESVLMKYMVDTHLDEVWTQFLVEILSQTYLTPNPFPALVTVLRQAALRMHLYADSNDQVVKRVQHNTPKLEDGENFIYAVPGCDGHGHISAMCILDTAAFFMLNQLVKPFDNRTFVQRKGRYKIAMTLALSSHTPLYGRMDPYLKQVDLHEHCYIKGPHGCAADAVAIYSKIVIDHINDVLKNDDFPVQGFYMGVEETRWCAEDLQNRKRAFQTEFERIVLLKQPLYLKLFVVKEWFYVPIVKKYLFHFTNQDETQKEMFFDNNPVWLYQNIFFKKEKAAFHFQQGATPDSCSPYTGPNLRIAFRIIDKKIRSEIDNKRWIDVHRWLLTKSLMNQNTAHIAETWRMLHSVAAQLEYINCLNLSIQELILYGLEERAKLFRRREDEQGDPHFLGCLDLIILGKMVQGYRSKLEQVLKTQACMAPKTFPEMVETKLKSIVEWHIGSRNLYVKIEPASVQKLEQVRQMCAALQDILSHDVHLISPEAKAAVKSIRAEAKNTRPSSPEPGHQRTLKIYLNPADDIHNEWRYIY
ncbi:uncharacterized protein LOC141899427 isoform X2 [Tubulanus polymorphus]|uniref:uncharacterized protein LOC141899427 isoform X2 n=1 Tax=Tubulanus polymorphus TaxID=672921 RepID=UPI003DA58BBD